MDLIELEYVEVVNEIPTKKSLKFSKELLKQSYKLESLFVIKVEGESMQPLIQDSALIVADLSQVEVINEGIYIVYKENQMWVKQAKIQDENISFISLNKEYSHLVFQSNEARVVARAVLTFTSL